jgi:predicted adenylyl cyclase CyaB
VNFSATPLRANVELKARLADPAAAVATALALGAEDLGTDEQTDTYFSLGRERLKLRESSTGAHRLIRYSRPDAAGARKSSYRLLPVSDPAAMRAMFERQWGTRAVVRKTRRLFLWEGRVRIHVDRVEGLGDFLEFEAVLDPDRPSYDESAARLDVARLAHDFAVADADLVATSYATLALEAGGTPSGT